MRATKRGKCGEMYTVDQETEVDIATVDQQTEKRTLLRSVKQSIPAQSLHVARNLLGMKGMASRERRRTTTGDITNIYRLSNKLGEESNPQRHKQEMLRSRSNSPGDHGIILLTHKNTLFHHHILT